MQHDHTAVKVALLPNLPWSTILPEPSIDPATAVAAGTLQLLRLRVLLLLPLLLFTTAPLLKRSVHTSDDAASAACIGVSSKQQTFLYYPLLKTHLHMFKAAELNPLCLTTTATTLHDSGHRQLTGPSTARTTAQPPAYPERVCVRLCYCCSWHTADWNAAGHQHYSGLQR